MKLFCKNNHNDLDINILTISFSIIALSIFSSSNILMIVILSIFVIFYLGYKKIDFNFDYIIKIFINCIASLSISCLSIYYVDNPSTIVIPFVCFIIYLILFFIYFFYKKNNANKKYWHQINNISINWSQIQNYFLMVLLFLFSILVIFFIVIKIQNVEALFFINNFINFNSNENYKEVSNNIFLIFYFVLFAVSLIIFFSTIMNLKKYKQSFVMVSYFIIIGFNPLIFILANKLNEIFPLRLSIDIDVLYSLFILMFVIFNIMNLQKIDFSKINFASNKWMQINKTNISTILLSFVNASTISSFFVLSFVFIV